MPTQLEWLAPSAGILGAVLVASANYAVQRWRYTLDRVSAAVDHASSEINTAADLATKYWLLDATQAAERKEARGIEPELIGRQLRIQEIILSLEIVDKKVSFTAVRDALPDLFEQLTGGQFRGASRVPDPDRAQSVQAQAAKLNGILRSAVAVRSKAWT